MRRFAKPTPTAAIDLDSHFQLFTQLDESIQPGLGLGVSAFGALSDFARDFSHHAVVRILRLPKTDLERQA